jgi:hypothetical protein
MAPQAIEIAQNGLGNGDPPARGCWEGESIRRIPYHASEDVIGMKRRRKKVVQKRS